MIHELFMKLYSDDDGPFQPHVLLHNKFPRLRNKQLAHLNKHYVGSEVKKAAFNMSPYKAPGLDGYQALFFEKL